MPSNAWTPLANLTLGSNQSTVTFSSISQSYRDLVLVMSVEAVSGNSLTYRLNSDTGTNYSWVQMAAGGGGLLSNAGSGLTTLDLSPNTLTDSTNYDLCTVNILDYTATDKHKTAITRYTPASTSNNVNELTQRWASTAAVTSIAITISNSGLS